MSELAVAAPVQGEPRVSDWRLVRAVARKELTEIARDARIGWLIALGLALMIGALAFGVSQRQHLERERHAAAVLDRSLWTGQSSKDPHAAAHFGQYAFKPESVLALADPGVDAYVGSAVRLEAHKQNHTQFRAARDSSVAGRLGGLSLAFVLQTILPLVAILLCFGGFSGERERGSLKQALSVGASPVHLLMGKALAAFCMLSALLGPALVLVSVCSFFLTDPDHFSALDQFARIGLLALGYGLYLFGFVLLALAISALSRSSRAAFVVSMAFWLVNCFVAPRAMIEFARVFAPTPTANEFHAAIAAERANTFGHDDKHPAFVAFRDATFKQYGVSRVEDLPVNFRGLALRKDDENGYAIYDRHFRSLQEAFQNQDSLRALPGFLLPFLALQPWSMSFSGSDSWHHFDFATAAEAHRRIIQTMVSDDLIHNGRYGDPSYAADPALWSRIPSFEYRAPDAAFAFSHVRENLVSLLLWVAMTSLFAFLAARRIKPI